MKMLAMVEYGERAGSGLQGIFKTWQNVYHSIPKLEVTTSGGVDRTVLTLAFEGHQPDIEAMKQLYGNSDDLIEVSDTRESSPEIEGSTQEILPSTQEQTKDVQQNTQETLNSTQESIGNTQESLNSTQEIIGNTQETSISNRERLITLLRDNPRLTLADVAEMIGLTRDGVKKIVYKLRSEGILSRKGSTKAGEWIVKDGI